MGKRGLRWQLSTDRSKDSQAIALAAMARFGRVSELVDGAPLTPIYNSRVRSEMPAPLEYRLGQVVT